jgi:hypothetical protein
MPKPCQAHDRLRKAVEAILLSAHWYPDRNCDSVALFQELREAADIPQERIVEKLVSVRQVMSHWFNVDRKAS